MTVPDSKSRVARPVALAFLVAAIMIALFIVDRSMANWEQRELRSEAEQRYQQGMRELKAGKVRAAVDNLQRAQALARGDDRYSLGFIEALIAAGRTDEAERRLREILSKLSNNGHANLLMARIMAAKGDYQAADSFYHRAIYGSWLSNPAQNRLDARIELAQSLARRGERQQLLSETLLLQNQAESNPELEKTVAELFLAAGTPLRAAAVYRQMATENPLDVDAYKGVGESEILAGDYRTAQTAFLAALRREPGDPVITARLRFANTLAQLDPTPRRLSSAEKYRRSTRILELVQAQLEQCHGPEGDKPTQEVTAALKARPRTITNELTEERLTLAEQLWQYRTKACPAQAAPDEPLPLIMAKLSQ
jgi:tetratricopeptide (TPR) repeat protein